MYINKAPLLAGAIQRRCTILFNILIPQIIWLLKPCNDLKDSNYLSVKTTLNRCVFRRDLKCSRDDGNLFHKVGAATLKAQSPYDLSRDTGTCKTGLWSSVIVKWRTNCILVDIRCYSVVFQISFKIISLLISQRMPLDKASFNLFVTGS